MTNHEPIRCQVDGCPNEVTCIVNDGQESPFATCGQHSDHDCDCGQCINAHNAPLPASRLLAALFAKEEDDVELCDTLAKVRRELFEAKLRIKDLEESLVLAQSEPQQTHIEPNQPTLQLRALAHIAMRTWLEAEFGADELHEQRIVDAMRALREQIGIAAQQPKIVAPPGFGHPFSCDCDECKPESDDE